jgi:hypothetical protein
MSEAIKRRRGTTAEHSAFTGLEGEVTVDTSKKTAVVHDGVTPGGFPLARADQISTTAEDVSYDGALSGLAANDVQTAVDELSAGKASTTAVTASLAGKLDRMPGVVVGSVLGTYTANTALTATIPPDDTPPQSNEGTQIISVTITPKSATNKLRARFSGQYTLAAQNNTIAAIFKGTTLVTAVMATSSSGFFTPINFEGEIVAGAVTAQTFTVRIGPTGAASLFLNGNQNTRYLGGASAATLVVEEIQV